MTVAPQVTANLRANGIEAHTVSIFRWLDEAAGLVAFVHTATAACGCILDATARQFGPQLPDLWVAPIDEYLDRLAEATGVQSATAHTDQGGQAPIAGGA